MVGINRLEDHLEDSPCFLVCLQAVQKYKQLFVLIIFKCFVFFSLSKRVKICLFLTYICDLLFKDSRHRAVVCFLNIVTAGGSVV